MKDVKDLGVMKDVKVYLRGGLGNQLFQFAAGTYLARLQDENVVFRKDLLPSEPDSIGGISRWPEQITEFAGAETKPVGGSQPRGRTNFLSKLMQAQRLLGDSSGQLLPRFGIVAGERVAALNIPPIKRVRIVNSYCSSLLPALSLGDELREQIKNVANPSTLYSLLLEQAAEEAPVMVHVRIGDYAGLADLYGKPDFGHIGGELARVRETNSSPIWLFTDSPQEISRELQRDLDVSRIIGPHELQRPIENLVLLATGSHLICSNSTFSWWAAFLRGNGPSVAFPKLKTIPHRIFADDMILEGWVPYGDN